MGTCLVRLFSKTCFKKLVFLEKKKDISSIFVKKYMFRKETKNFETGTKKQKETLPNFPVCLFASQVLRIFWSQANSNIDGFCRFDPLLSNQ